MTEMVAPIARKVCDIRRAHVTARNAVACVLGVFVAASNAAGARCQWVEPGAAPYGPNGDLRAAVMRLEHIPEPHRSILADSVAKDTPAEVTRITRNGFESKRWKMPRNMNFAGGRICWGEVDVSMWPEQRSQIARMHASGPFAVAHYPGCNNISEATDSWYSPSVIERVREAIGIKPKTGAAPQQSTQQAPEPSTWPLVAVALAGVVAMRGRRK